MNFDELAGVSKAIYKNTIEPIALTDAKLNVCWANAAAIKRFPSLTLQDGIIELVNNYDYRQIIEFLKTGRTFLAQKLSEPFNEVSVRIIPVLDENELIGCQLFFSYEGFSEKALPDIHSEKVIAAFSKEYKMPLTVIFSTLGLMARHLQDSDDDITKSYIKLITQNSYRILRLSNNLVDVSRYRSGIAKLDLKRGDLCAFISGLCEAAMILTRSIDIPLDCVVPEKRIITTFDPGRLSLAIYNLISNSCKYTRDGNRICIRLEEQSGKAVITVSDKGEGIRSGNIGHIFDPYSSFKSDAALPGAGLGLSIVKFIIIQHGGTVALQSDEGSGTTVAFSLPIRQDENLPYYTAEKSADYLANRFSTLYVEMSDVCGCPLP